MKLKALNLGFLLSALFSITTFSVFAQTLNSADYVIGIANMSGNTLDEAKQYAREKSEGCLILLYCGIKEDVLKEVLAGADEAKRQGANFKGVIVGPQDTSQKESTESFRLYYNGFNLDEYSKNIDNGSPRWSAREVILLVHRKVQKLKD